MFRIDNASQIGNGAYAKVYANYKLACKVPVDNAADYVHTVLREGLLLHGGYGVPLIGLAQTGAGRLQGFVMERAAGTLDRWQFLLDEKATEDATTPLLCLASLLRDISHQLAIMHAARIVHADVKPRNCLVMQNGHASLADFGLARIEEETYQDEAYTYSYRPPELLMGRQPKPLRSSDVWALGLIAWECLMGRLDFHDAETDADLHQGHVRLRALLTDLEEAIPRRWPGESEATYLSLIAFIRMCVVEEPLKRGSAQDAFEILKFTSSVKVPITMLFSALSNPTHSFEWTDSLTLSTSPVTLKGSLNALVEDVSRNVCQLVHLKHEKYSRASATLFETLTKAHIGPTNLARAVISAVLCVYLRISGRALKHEHCCKMASLTLLQFEEVLQQALAAAIQCPSWSFDLFVGPAKALGQLSEA